MDRVEARIDATYDLISTPNGEGHTVSNESLISKQRYICGGIVAVGVHSIRTIPRQRRRESHICIQVSQLAWLVVGVD